MLGRKRQLQLLSSSLIHLPSYITKELFTDVFCFSAETHTDQEQTGEAGSEVTSAVS